MQATLDQTLKDNTKLTFDVGFYSFVASVIISFFAFAAAVVDFKGRGGVTVKAYEETVI